MPVRLTEGTKEIVPVTVHDRTGLVTDLSAAGCNFDLYYDDHPVTPAVYENQAASASGMEVFCLLDLSATGPDGVIPADTRLRLFVSFAVGTEIPRLGQLSFKSAMSRKESSDA